MESTGEGKQSRRTKGWSTIENKEEQSDKNKEKQSDKKETENKGRERRTVNWKDKPKHVLGARTHRSPIKKQVETGLQWEM
jgi:hypothetical protein